MSSIVSFLEYVLDRQQIGQPVQLSISNFLGDKHAVKDISIKYEKQRSNNWILKISVGPKLAICDENEVVVSISHELSHVILGHLNLSHFKVVDYVETCIPRPFSIAFLEVYTRLLRLNRRSNELAADRQAAKIFGAMPSATALIKSAAIDVLIDTSYETLPFCKVTPSTFLGFSERYQQLAKYLNDNTDHFRSICQQIEQQCKGDRDHPSTKCRVQNLGLAWDECVENLCSTGFNLLNAETLFDGLIDTTFRPNLIDIQTVAQNRIGAELGVRPQRR